MGTATARRLAGSSNRRLVGSFDPDTECNSPSGRISRYASFTMAGLRAFKGMASPLSAPVKPKTSSHIYALFCKSPKCRIMMRCLNANTYLSSLHGIVTGVIVLVLIGITYVSTVDRSLGRLGREKRLDPLSLFLLHLGFGSSRHT